MHCNRKLLSLVLSIMLVMSVCVPCFAEETPAEAAPVAEEQSAPVVVEGVTPAPTAEPTPEPTAVPTPEPTP